MKIGSFYIFFYMYENYILRIYTLQIYTGVSHNNVHVKNCFNLRAKIYIILNIVCIFLIYLYIYFINT